MRGAFNYTFRLISLIFTIFLLVVSTFINHRYFNSPNNLVYLYPISFLIGYVLGGPGGKWRLKALEELHERIKDEFHLTMDLAILDSYHGKNSIAYYFILCVPMLFLVILNYLYGFLDFVFFFTCYFYYFVGVYLRVKILPVLKFHKIKGI